MPSRALLSCLLLTVAFAASAQQYRWVDEKGRVQYSDTPPPPGAKGVQKKNIRPSPGGPSGDSTEPYALQVARKNAPVKLYTSPDCGALCDEARKLLNRRGIPFGEISIADTAQLEELKTVSGGAAVPVMVAGKTVQKGFEEGAFQRVLDDAGYPPMGTLKPRTQVAPPPPKESPAVPPPPAGAESVPTK